MRLRSLPEYSVLMSTYAMDVPEHLDDAIKSMVNQTVPFLDLVLVCDGPLSEKLDLLLKKWGEELGSRIKVVRLPDNRGLGEALKLGLRECECDIVARMDSDDISRPQRMEILLSKMVEEQLDLVGGAIEEFDLVPGDMGRVRMHPLMEIEIDACMKRRNPFNHVSVVFSRRAVEGAGGYEPFRWLEDYWLWARMAKSGCRYANVPDVVVDVRTGEGMYARRSNFSYLRSQIRFFGELRRLGLVTRMEQVRAIAERSLASLLPTPFVKVAYNKFLREDA